MFLGQIYLRTNGKRIQGLSQVLFGTQHVVALTLPAFVMMSNAPIASASPGII